SGYTLTYFPLRGRAEAMRLLLGDQGVSWTDDEVQMQDWAAGIRDLKKNAVFGQIPRFQEGDFVLYQSQTILRLLARYGLSGSNEREIAINEMMNDGVEDLRLKYYKFIFWDNEANKEKFLEELATQLGYFERILTNNAGKTFVLVGDKISYADYNLLDTLFCVLDLSPTCLSGFPLLSDYVERLGKRPKLQQYLKSEGRKRRPINGNGKQ
uniref:Glutathione S-transferase P 2 n=1 Tax=Bufo bufo TaxID=8384 RepID=GSTP2_BUFBU|nr:RecName: Full=Glutathione S-transferase P 2; AltName: Full=BBGSTP2-2; AltName: Full=GST class-pi [Bufo bufo]